MAKMNSSGSTPPEELLPLLQDFAIRLTAKFSASSAGEPEDQLKAPIDRLLTGAGRVMGKDIVLKGESLLEGRLGQPDFAIHDGKLLIGYVELKAPGKGANPDLFKGHDREQWKRFQNVPNLVYTDGNEWALYRGGKLVGKRVRLAGDVQTDGKSAARAEDASALFRLFAEFVAWKPIVPGRPKALAAFLAPYCRLIRDEVLDSLKDGNSPLRGLQRELKQLLFPDASGEQFADAYAQTVIFALLLARLDGADVLELNSAYNALASHHLLLSRALQFLTDPLALKEVASSVGLAQRAIGEVGTPSFEAKSTTEDPWLFFYEHFLAEYDPEKRRASGVYYTPVEIVRCQVRLIDEILTKRLGKEMGFVEPGVVTLDPAVGTGTYLLGIIEHALDRVGVEEGPGAVKGGARSLIHNLHGFEWMVGPYAVAQLRFSREFTARGVSLPPAGPGIYLMNTLESPHPQPPAPPLFHRPIAQEHERALKVKESEQVLVCVGNPPYGRHDAAEAGNEATTGGWVRHGARRPDGEPEPPILESFREPARKAGYGVDVKNLYNLYVYFIRWALWKVFEHKSATGPGVVSFITASSYLDGNAFVGVREHMRRECDYIDIIDLGGEGRGTRREEGVFAIQTPVCIFVGWRKGQANRQKPAVVRYARIDGTREEKLKALHGVTSAKDLDWKEVPSEWQAPFRPGASGRFSLWPSLTDIFPWQQSGAQFKRSWPIAPEPAALRERWKVLTRANEKSLLFRESRDRKLATSYPDLLGPSRLAPLATATESDMTPPVRYGYRSFDRQYVIPDNRLGDFLRPSLWRSLSERQVYLTTLLNHPLGGGPAVTASAYVPDMHHFRGSFGAKEVIPLYRDSRATEPNLLPGLPRVLEDEYGFEPTVEDLAGYVYAILAQPEYTSRFSKELSSRKVRVPLTKDEALFRKVAKFGKALIWLHTYGERMIDGGERAAGRIPRGTAKCLVAVPDSEERYPNEFSYDVASRTLQVGDGRFGPVDPRVIEFEVSGLMVVHSWLGYRMRDRHGKKSSPLDDVHPRRWTHEFTRELLELLWVIEKTIAGYAEQNRLLEAVLASRLFKADELPPVPVAARKEPRIPKPKKQPEGQTRVPGT